MDHFPNFRVKNKKYLKPSTSKVLTVLTSEFQVRVVNDQDGDREVTSQTFTCHHLFSSWEGATTQSILPSCGTIHPRFFPVTLLVILRYFKWTFSGVKTWPPFGAHQKATNGRSWFMSLKTIAHLIWLERFESWNLPCHTGFSPGCWKSFLAPSGENKATLGYVVLSEEVPSFTQLPCFRCSSWMRLQRKHIHLRSNSHWIIRSVAFALRLSFHWQLFVYIYSI